MRGTYDILIRRFLTALVALLALQAGSLVAPAYACGCGAMVPDASRRIGVDREESAVRWDGRTETIVMRFRVHGDAERAAWIMPVPSRADVSLGDPELFDQIDRLTAPERRDRFHFWPREDDWPFDTGYGDGAGAMPGAGTGVGVVGRERLGPFDVARLTATDPDALGDWLRTNGFDLPERLTGALRPYVERKWEYVAVRLAPEEEGAVLRGELTPLRIAFASPELVYPMRLSRLAKTPQTLGLAVLADHRMEPRSAIGGDRPEVTFAGRIERPEGAVAALAGDRPVHLTVLEQKFPNPERIDGDHHLERVADTPYREVVYTDRLLTVAGIPAWLLTVGGALLLTAVAVILAVRASRRRRAPVAGVRSAA
ncbi:hypothetical protein GCM10010497_50840 [Streptomyces cinereoruber]|uniref:DUF2330 domain-containing protein n=1 Tax=Streptomyces cinereoruber TaxID=67260 RepID=A0AAV4KQZ0_9ACTN|nr:DUF2330 domain-containing protein [Streptomyces cinereoruber]MBB4156080.1 hypothetical protein [Streptomyces cinereoruber]MBY8819582.1 DUF2330 domain-containing protein [Streptomyces cinereoruber]NIH64891.1 hypothetical protein [Streptomyces cinereoruber]QEV32564.1 DUF2330 domain-containing protein [Streptomyces cinereoruber]GGR41403.1 hypothetical protein GCM10010497_50840 [Streptomyces cinereoruber]